MLTILVTFETSLGNIDVELFDEVAPETVENFLNYIRDGDYTDSIFHRSARLQSGAPFVVQGGGFYTDFSSVPTDDPVVNEFGISNTRGTIAMAKIGGNPDSATSQWFFNLGDNSDILDNQNGGFTVFGRVVGGGMDIVDAIAALPIFAFASPFNELPLRDYTQNDFPQPPEEENLVVLHSITIAGATVEGSVFNDANANAQRDPGEAPRVGVVVYLDENGNGTLDEGELSRETDEQGNFQFTGIQPGVHVFRHQLPPNTILTLPQDESRAVTVGSSGQTVTGVDFGTVTLSNQLSIDLLAAFDTGILNNDNLTSRNNSSEGTTLSFEVSGVIPGSRVEIFSGSTRIGEANATGNSVVIRTNGTELLADREHFISATQTFRGQSATTISLLPIRIDATVPLIDDGEPSDATLDVPFSFDIDTNEDAFDGTRFTLLSGPDGMVIDEMSGVVSWTPGAGQLGTHTFRVRVNDLAGNTTTKEYSVRVRPTNSVPVARSEFFTLDEDTVLQIAVEQGVLANDTDDDDDPLVARLISGPQNGQFTLNEDGSFEYTPNANFHGTDRFRYVAHDGAADSNEIEVVLTVRPVPDSPIGEEDVYTVVEDNTLSVTLQDGVLANDSDGDGDALTAVLETNPEHGTLTLQANGSFVYTPEANFNGVDRFTYRLQAGGETTDPIEVTISVASVNDPPVAGADNYSTQEDQELDVPEASGVLANDDDPVEQSPLTAVLLEGPSHGSLELRPDGSFRYIPDENFFGTDSFRYAADDGQTQSSPQTVTINIEAIDDPPVAVADEFTFAEDMPLDLSADGGVLANDIEPDGQTLVATLVTSPQHGQLTFNADGSFRYVPDPNFHGVDSFRYEVSDGTTTSPSVEVTLNIVSVNDPPATQSDTYEVDEDQPLNIDAILGVLANDQDIEGEPLTAVLDTGPRNGTVTLRPDGSFSYRPRANFFGTDSFTYRASDGEVASNPVEVSITVRPVDDPPVLAQVPNQTVFGGSPLTVSVNVTDLDASVANVTFSLMDPVPEGASIDPVTGQFQWTPPFDTQGDFVIRVLATDNTPEALTDQIEFTVSVIDVRVFGLTINGFGAMTPPEFLPPVPVPENLLFFATEPLPPLSPVLAGPDNTNPLSRIQSGGGQVEVRLRENTDSEDEGTETEPDNQGQDPATSSALHDDPQLIAQIAAYRVIQSGKAMTPSSTKPIFDNRPSVVPVEAVTPGTHTSPMPGLHAYLEELAVEKAPSHEHLPKAQEPSASPHTSESAGQEAIAPGRSGRAAILAAAVAGGWGRAANNRGRPRRLHLERIA